MHFHSSYILHTIKLNYYKRLLYLDDSHLILFHKSVYILYTILLPFHTFLEFVKYMLNYCNYPP